MRHWGPTLYTVSVSVHAFGQRPIIAGSEILPVSGQSSDDDDDDEGTADHQRNVQGRLDQAT